ncbi:hypothetical protein YK48G_12540 [Lentilactobacillus fungorum]|uniref:Uncharacterized protein n=1 Tax=Lentilactobacillus fungorum TaxID=2201250 RepID=A0ABQ3VZQ8_9LACO|nr:hypothetical protein YK48G_12540 [Lentilactobacillus fungorum]
MTIELRRFNGRINWINYFFQGWCHFDSSFLLFWYYYNPPYKAGYWAIGQYASDGIWNLKQV